MLIGEVAQRSGVSTRMLRHYDSLGLVRPTGRTTGGYREYSDADLERLVQVESLRSLGLSLRDVARALDDPAFSPEELTDRLIRETQARMAADTTLLARLRQIRSARPEDWSMVLDVVGLLRGVRSEHAAHRQRAALRANELGVPGEPLAEALLVESDANVAGALRWALAQLPDSLGPLISGAAEDDPLIRRRTVVALAGVDDARAVRTLEQALTDTDPVVRRTAASALGRLGREPAVPALVELIATGDGDVEAAEILAAFGDDQRIIGVLVDRLGDDPDPAVRLRLVQALAEFAADAASPALERLTTDRDETVSRTARYIRERSREG